MREGTAGRGGDSLIVPRAVHRHRYLRYLNDERCRNPFYI